MTIRLWIKNGSIKGHKVIDLDDNINKYNILLDSPKVGNFYFQFPHLYRVRYIQTFHYVPSPSFPMHPPYLILIIIF